MSFGPQSAIDTHAHVFPDTYLDFLQDHGRPEKEIAIARGMNADSSEADMSARLEWMDRAGVATQVIAVTPQVPSLPDAGDSLSAARLVNDEYAEIVGGSAGRFLAYGALPLPHIEETLAEIPRIFDELGFLGVSIPTITMGDFFLNDASLDPVWEALNERHAIVNVHPTGSGACSQMLLDSQLEWVNGAPVEDATTTLQMLKADIPRRFPNLTFHIAHLGGDLPFLARRIEDNYEDWDAFPASPNQQLQKMYFDAANFHEPSLRLTAETFGSSQILGGSDFPYFQKEKYVRAFSYVRDSKLTPDEIDGVLFGNAQRLYGL